MREAGQDRVWEGEGERARERERESVGERKSVYLSDRRNIKKKKVILYVRKYI